MRNLKLNQILKQIQKMTTSTNLKDLEVFVQNFRSIERFIQMLTCLLLLRSMNLMVLCMFDEWMKT